MNIVRTRPWPLQGPFQSELRQAFDLLFGGAMLDQNDTDDSAVVTSQWVPHVDVREEGDRFVLYADLPGIDPDQIEVSMDKGILSIKGERKTEAVTESEHYSRVERAHGVFYRRFALPDSANPEGITAAGKHGVLEITIPKRAETTPRRIQVQ